jgi:hypothetical protein
VERPAGRPRVRGAALTRFEAVVSVLRDITRSALAGLIVGVVVLGIGGRIVMRLAALIDPSSAGRHTENGNRIGDITLEGTAVLIIFGGLLVGAAASVVWVAIQEWIPGRPAARALLAMPIALALTGFQLVRPENHDFRILAPVGPILVLLLALVAIAGFASPWSMAGWTAACRSHRRDSRFRSSSTAS